ncbi:MAG: hypothetical protein ACKVOH_00035 [Chlamydiales bacterium]
MQSHKLFLALLIFFEERSLPKEERGKRHSQKRDHKEERELLNEE